MMKQVLNSLLLLWLSRDYLTNYSPSYEWRPAVGLASDSYCGYLSLQNGRPKAQSYLSLFCSLLSTLSTSDSIKGLLCMFLAVLLYCCSGWEKLFCYKDVQHGNGAWTGYWIGFSRACTWPLSSAATAQYFNSRITRKISAILIFFVTQLSESCSMYLV